MAAKKRRPSVKREIEREVEKEIKVVEKEAKIAEKEIISGLHKFEKFFVKEGETIEHDILYAGRKLRKFGALELVEVFIGAIILLTIFAFQGGIWIWGIVADWNIIIGLNVAVLIATYILLYLSGYVRAKRHHPLLVHSTTVRVIATYAVCFVLVFIYLTIFRSGEWWYSPVLGMKQVFALLIPAMIGGVSADFLLE